MRPWIKFVIKDGLYGQPDCKSVNEVQFHRLQGMFEAYGKIKLILETCDGDKVESALKEIRNFAEWWDRNEMERCESDLYYHHQKEAEGLTEAD